MSDSNENEKMNSKNLTKDKSYNLLQTLMNEPKLKNINQQTNYINPLQNQQNVNINNNIKNQTNSKINSNNNIGNINIMQIMKTKISNNDYNSIKELLKNSNITQQAKNKLLYHSFRKYNLTNNRNQRKIIIELINHGADPNKLNINETNDNTEI